MERSFLNHATVTRLLEPMDRRLPAVIHDLANAYGEDAICAEGMRTGIVYSPSGYRVASPEIGGIGTAIFVQEVDDANLPQKLPNRMIEIATPLLTRQPRKYYVYRISFVLEKDIHEENGRKLADHPLAKGYVGITKRSVFTRYREHRAQAIGAGRTTLYSAWRYLFRKNVRHIPVLSVIGAADTLEEAYALEESLVAERTLTPMGLNTIPGGMAGIRMMHQLGLLNRTNHVSVVERDSALVRLETGDKSSPCAHMRAGHLRHLPSGNLTWVRPCWVNPILAAA